MPEGPGTPAFGGLLTFVPGLSWQTILMEIHLILLIISCKKGCVLFSHTSISNNDLPLALPEGGGAAMAA
jgi:hypothetical protein